MVVDNTALRASPLRCHKTLCAQWQLSIPFLSLLELPAMEEKAYTLRAMRKVTPWTPSTNLNLTFKFHNCLDLFSAHC